MTTHGATHGKVPSMGGAGVDARRRFAAGWLAAMLLVAAVASPADGANASGERPPNIVFILADDLGWHQLGCYGSGFYRTPNLDRLAGEGMRFTDAYAAAPICSPTRASIMTGKYPARLHLTNYIAGHMEHQKLLPPPDWQKQLPLAEVTIAEALKQRGYATGHFGKWHLNRDKNYRLGRPGDPMSQGFDVVLTTHKPLEDAGGPLNPRDPHHVDRITEAATLFMQANRDRPFFCYVAHNAVHRPDLEQPEMTAKYENHPLRWEPGNRPVMAGMIEHLDDGIGRLLEVIDTLGLRENTVVVFFSDNGMFDDPRTRKPLRGAKGHIYEAGIRVPLIVRWPGVVAPGTVSDEVVISNDFFPTFVEVAGGGPAGHATDGVSLLPVLKQEGTLQRDAVYFHYPHYSPQGGAPAGAMRQGRWKLVVQYEPVVLDQDLERGLELYDLQADPGESRDLSAEQPAKTRELWERYQAWLKSVGAQEVIRNPGYVPGQEHLDD